MLDLPATRMAKLILVILILANGNQSIMALPCGEQSPTSHHLGTGDLLHAKPHLSINVDVPIVDAPIDVPAALKTGDCCGECDCMISCSSTISAFGGPYVTDSIVSVVADISHYRASHSNQLCSSIYHPPITT